MLQPADPSMSKVGARGAGKATSSLSSAICETTAEELSAHHQKDTSPVDGAPGRVVKGLYCTLGTTPQGLVMGAVLLNIWRRQWSSWSSSLQVTPDRGLMVALEGRAFIQNNLGGLERWASRDIVKFSQDRHQMLHLGRKEAFARILGGIWMVGEQLCGERLGSPGGQQAGHETAAWSGSKESPQHHQPYWQQCRR